MPVLIKIDVEGHELAVLQGAQTALASSALQAVIMETNGSGGRYGVADAELITEMKKFGFSAYSYNPLQRILENHGQCHGGNTVFVKDPEAIQDRVSSARRFRLVNGDI